MRGDERVVKKLDELLCDELTAIMQDVVHAEMCANWKNSSIKWRNQGCRCICLRRPTSSP